MIPHFHEFELTASLLSVFGACFVFLGFVLCPAFRGHPSEIIFMISLSDLCLALKFVVRSTAWLVNDTPDYTNRSFHLFNDDCITSLAWSAFFENLTIAWNAVWCFNLFYQLKYPQKSTKRMRRAYFIYTTLAACTVVLVQMLGTNRTEFNNDGYVYCTVYPKNLKNWTLIFELVYFFFHLGIAIFSVIYALHRFRRIPSSFNMKSLFLRHFAYVFIFFSVWLGERLSGILHVRDTSHQIAALFWVAQGFFVAIVRATEPQLLRAMLVKMGCSSRCIACCFRRNSNSAFKESVHERTHRLITELSYRETTDLNEHYPIETANERYYSETDSLMEAVRPEQVGWGANDALKAELEFSDSFGPVGRRTTSVSSQDGFNFKSSNNGDQQMELYGDL